MKDEQTPEMSADLIALYGPPLSVYTRADAVSDGVFMDVTDHEVTRRYRLNYPLHLSRALADQYVTWDQEDTARQGFQEEAGRLSDLLSSFTLARRLLTPEQLRGRTMTFGSAAVPRDGVTRSERRVRVYSEITAGDGGGPLMTWWLDGERRD